MGFIQETTSLIVALLIAIFGFFIFLPLIAESVNTSPYLSYAIGSVLVLAIAAIFAMNIMRR